MVDPHGHSADVYAGWAAETWRVEHLFDDGSANVRGQNGAAFRAHDLRGLRHEDGAPIRMQIRGVCEREGCTRLPVRICGRFE